MAQYSRPTTPLNGPDQTSQSQSPASPLSTNQHTEGPSQEGPSTSPWTGYQLHQEMIDMQADDNYNNSQADDGDADTQTHNWRSVNLQDIYVENAPDVSSQPDDQLQEKIKPQHPELKMQGRQPWRRVTEKDLENGRKQLEEALLWSRSEEGQRRRRRHRELARAEIAKHRPPSPGPDDDFDLDWEGPLTASKALEVDISDNTTFQPKETLHTSGFGFKANEAVGKDAYKVSIWDRTTFLPMETLYSGGFGFKVKEVDDEEETVVSGLEPTVEEAEEGLMKDTDVSAVAKHGRDGSSDDDNSEVDIWASTTFLPKKTLYTGGFGFKVRTLDRDLDDIRKELARGEDFEVEEVDDEEETVVSGLEPTVEEAEEGLMKDTHLSAVAKHGGDESSDDDNSPKRQKR
ncbi:hypothetical protein COL154_009166 [Colletotrichum chrysophilum]|nr:hypothetical protein COL154_009166 [Colletotrichum chrysophilum]